MLMSWALPLNASPPRYLSCVYVRLHRNKRISEWGLSHSQHKGREVITFTPFPSCLRAARELVFHIRYSLEPITPYVYQTFRLTVSPWPSPSRQTSRRRGRHILSFRDRCRIPSLAVAIDRWGVIVKWLGRPRRVRDKHITHAGIRKDRLTRPPRISSPWLTPPQTS